MLRTLEIENIYEDFDDVTTTVTVELRDRRSDESDDEWDEYLRDEIFPLTGVGDGAHETGNSSYFAESTDNLEPHINLEWC